MTEAQWVRVVSDRHYVHSQVQASEVWEVHHNLGKKPSVTVVDSGGNVVVGSITHLDVNSLTITFSASFGGECYCN